MKQLKNLKSCKQIKDISEQKKKKDLNLHRETRGGSERWEGRLFWNEVGELGESDEPLSAE